jgi:hypothetical protein
VTSMSNHAAELVELEKRFWIEGGGRPGFWQAHFADDGVVVLPIGIMDKDETLQAMQGAPSWTRVEMDELRVVPLSNSSVLLAYRASARRAVDQADFEAVVGSVYRRQDGAWQLVFHQQSYPAVSGD